ncbi:MAG: hypothetical protein WCI03_12220 [bacterium]|jgi:hypothetical protein
MRNVTIALDDTIFEAGRLYAREHHTSLNGLIRRLLQQTVVREQSRGACDEFFAVADRAKGSSRGKRWSREELHRG